LALRSGRTEDSSGIMEYLETGGGRIVLAVMTVGFFAYGAWRLVEAWVDTSNYGKEAKGIAIRFAGAVAGLVYLGLGVAAASHLLGSGGGSGGGAPEKGAATALSLPGGQLIVLIAAAGLLFAGVQQGRKAWKLDFLRHLEPRAAGSRRVAWIGRTGFAARGVVFLTAAWLMLRSGLDRSSEEAGGIGDALQSMDETVQMAVAAGLVLFGLFSLVEAWFRRIRDPQVLERLRAAVG
ncbi:MAG TPA: DUF1206 domain-containing protein, partial [Allosphingosinicella sp.]|nr:DUF1206 domain-containing protein [Allosphingosinicella sp.]